MTTKADEQRFVAYYHKMVDEQIAQRQIEYDNHYIDVESEVKNLMNTDQGRLSCLSI